MNSREFERILWVRFCIMTFFLCVLHQCTNGVSSHFFPTLLPYVPSFTSTSYMHPSLSDKRCRVRMLQWKANSQPLTFPISLFPILWLFVIWFVGCNFLTYKYIVFHNGSILQPPPPNLNRSKPICCCVCILEICMCINKFELRCKIEKQIFLRFKWFVRNMFNV